MTSLPQQFRLPIWLGACLFGAIAVFFLWEEHHAHFLGALPYVLLLACPFMHLLMHHGHRHGHGHEEDVSRDRGQHSHHRSAS